MEWLLVAVAMAACAIFAVPEATATFPGRNGAIAFDARGGVYVIKHPGAHPSLVAPKYSNSPSFSGDGSRIAYMHAGREEPRFAIWTVSADGSGATRLTDGHRNDFEPAFSPDGSEIAFTRVVGHRDHYPVPHLFLMRSDGSDQRELGHASLRVNVFEPTFSPSGRHIAYVRNRRSLVVVRADGGHQRFLHLPKVIRKVETPDYSPSGERLVFFASVYRNPQGWTHGIFSVPTGGGKVKQLTHGDKYTDPVYSPNGRRIAATHFGHHRAHVVTIGRSGTVRRIVKGPPHGESSASWAPR